MTTLRQRAVVIGTLATALIALAGALTLVLAQFGFEGTKSTGTVIHEMKDQMKVHVEMGETYKNTDTKRDSLMASDIRDLRQIVLDNRIATENNTVILCYMAKKMFPFCAAILRSRGMKND